METCRCDLPVITITGNVDKNLFEIEIAVAVTLRSYLFFMINAGTFDRPVFLFIPAPEPAGAVRLPELCLVPYESFDDRGKLFFIGVERPVMFLSVSPGPFEHIILSVYLFCHDIRPPAGSS